MRRWVLCLCVAAALPGQAQPPAQTPVVPAEPSPPAAAEPATLIGADAWRADLDVLAAELPARHVSPFTRISRDAWLAALNAAKDRAEGRSDAEMLVEVRRLVAMIGDGHTTAWAVGGEGTLGPARQFPLGLVWLTDGVFAAALPKVHADLAGRRLVRVGAVPIAEALDRVAAVSAADNASHRKSLAMNDLVEAETLAALGVIPTVDAAEFTFADAAGVEQTVRLEPVPAAARATVPMAHAIHPDVLAPTRRPARSAYGHELMPDRRVFYIWYDTCTNQPGKTVRQFVGEAVKALDEALAASPPSADRVIVDLRRNGGGDSTLLMPLVRRLKERTGERETLGLFVLIGRRTFSSAMMNAQHFRQFTRAVLVGEPTGGRANHFGEVRRFSLPNSRIAVQYSTKRFVQVPGEGESVAPDLSVELDSRAYFSPHDVPFDAAVAAPVTSPRTDPE